MSGVLASPCFAQQLEGDAQVSPLEAIINDAEAFRADLWTQEFGMPYGSGSSSLYLSPQGDLWLAYAVSPPLDHETCGRFVFVGYMTFVNTTPVPDMSPSGDMLEGTPVDYMDYYTASGQLVLLNGVSRSIFGTLVRLGVSDPGGQGVQEIEYFLPSSFAADLSSAQAGEAEMAAQSLANLAQASSGDGPIEACDEAWRLCVESAYDRYFAKNTRCLAEAVGCVTLGAAACIASGPFCIPCIVIVGTGCTAMQIACIRAAWDELQADVRDCRRELLDCYADNGYYP
jgi:hypothetical protein